MRQGNDTLRVLLVEDNPSDAELIGELVGGGSEGGFSLSRVESMARVAEYADQYAFEAILLDLNLPDSNGQETVARCRALFPRTAIIVLTGSREGTLGAELIQSGAQDYLPKDDLTPELLQRTILHSLERQRLEVERQAAEAAKNEQEALYRALVEGTSDFIQRLAPDGTITFGNQALADLLGETPEGLVGRSWFEFLSPEERPFAREYLAFLSPDNAVGHFEGSVPLGSGERRWIRWTHHAFFGEGGGLTSVQSMGMDITERKFHEVRARNQGNRLRALIETMVEGVIVIDGRGLIQDFNPAAETVFGYTAAEITGENVSALMPEPHRSAHDGYLQHYLETGEKRIIGIGREVIGMRRDGSTFPMELAVSETEIDGQTMFTGIVRDISHRKAMESALATEKERLRRGQQFANIGTWEWTIPTGDLYWSERIGPLFGYREKELETSYENFLGAIHPDDRQAVVDAVNATLTEDAPYDIEHRVVWPDGTVRWLLERGAAIRDEQGNALQMLGVVQDIDDRKRAELALVEREEALREAQALAHLGNWRADLQTGEIFWSDEIFRIFGYEPGAFQPTIDAFYDAVHPEDREKLSASEGEAERTGRHDIVHRIVRPSGEVRHVHEMAEASWDSQGALTHLMGTVQDITERVEAQERLTLFREIFESSDQAIGVTDAEGYFVYTNPAHDLLTGYGQEEILGRHFSMLLPDEGERDYASEIFEALRTWGHWADLVPLRREDGDWFTSASNVGAITDDQGCFKNLFNVFTDFTRELDRREELSRAKEEAERANQAKSGFLSSMSHELRTPMNAIIGFAQLMEYDEDLSRDHADNVHEILKAGQHLLELINEVLDLAKVESGRMELSLEPVAVDGLMEDVLPLVRNMARKHDVALGCDDLAGISVRADRTRLKQVLLNLVTNAIKYNSEPGQVHVHAEVQGETYVRIGISDTGPGIPPERVDDLFEPFNRLDAEHSGTEGSGIGLAFSQQVVELMGGEMELDTEVGRGSTFYVVLPAESLPVLEVGHADTVEPASEAGGEGSGERQTVLYIEDNPANLRLVEQILSHHTGIELISAHNAELGIELALSHRPSLILLDINLPGMSGYDILEILQEDETLKQVPVVAITANAMPRDVERGRQAGFADYLTKPLDVAHFKQVVEAYLVSAEENTGEQP